MREPLSFRSALPGATSKVLAAMSRGPIVRAASKTLVAGPERADATLRSREISAQGHLLAWRPILDEAQSAAQLPSVRDELFAAMDDLAALGTERPDLTLDLACFGVLSYDIPAPTLIAALRELGQHARNAGVTLTLTVSNPFALEAVYLLAAELRQDFPEVGTIMPTRLRRGLEDALEATRPGDRVRLTTARLDPAVGLTAARESGNAFVDIAKHLLQAGAHVGLETDDVLYIDIFKALVERFDAERCEVVAPLGAQGTLPASAHDLDVRVIVPYGTRVQPYVENLVAGRPSLAVRLPNPMRRRAES